MPIIVHAPVRRLSQDDFGELSYEVMRHVFEIHNEIGRFFDEKIYKRELAHRMPDIRLEVPVDVVIDSFQKRYWIDVLAGEGGLFEFKAVEALAGSHRAQLLNYLMLCGVEHGKLINVRAENVEHEFVNSRWEYEYRRQFAVDDSEWNAALPGAVQLSDFLTAALRDLGAGLEISLYEELAEHCFGGSARVEGLVEIQIGDRRLGQQRMRLIAPGVALKITALAGPLNAFEAHARRFLVHTDLRAIAWVNIDLKQVTFKTLQR